MFWNCFRTTRTTDKARRNSRRSSYRPRLEALEDRTLLTIFMVDPMASRLALSGTVGGNPIQEQGPGSLTTSYLGNLNASYDPRHGTIQFLAGGTNVVANNSGSWQPLPGGGSGSAPANYGGQATVIIVTAKVALRGFAANITSNVLSVDSTGNFPSNETFTSTAGSADYNAGSFGSGTVSVAGQSATNAAATPGHISNNIDLSIPINVTLSGTISGTTYTLHVVGTIVAHCHPGESFNCFCSIHISVDVYVLVFQGDLITNGVIPDQNDPLVLNDPLTNPFATTGHTPLSITVTPDGGNTDVIFRGDPSTPLVPGQGGYHGTYHFGLHDSTSGPPRLQLLSQQAMNSTTGETETVPAPTIVANPVHDIGFRWVTVFLNYGTTADDQTGGIFWNAPVPAGEAPNFSIVNVSGSQFFHSNIRMGDPSDSPPNIDTLAGDDLINSLHQIYGGPPIQTDPGDGTHLLIQTAPTTTAGSGLSITVTAYDASNNLVNNYTGTVHFTSTDPQATSGMGLPSDYTFTPADMGTHAFTATLKTAGSQRVTITDTVHPAISGMAAEAVNPAAADHFVVTTSAANPDVAGTPFDVTVTVQDAYNNTATGYTGTVHFSSADPHPATLPADYTFLASDAGQYTFPGGATLYTAGTPDVTATDAANNLSGTTNVTVVAGSAVAFVVMAPATATSGTPFDVMILAVDAYGNTDTNYAGTIHFSTTDNDPGVVLPPDYTFLPGDAGTHTFPAGVTLITAGSQTLTVTDVNSGITGSTIVTVM